MTGKLLNNRYEVIRTLGRGGFGETFLAKDTHLPSQRACVIKQLKPASEDPAILALVQERFAREAVILEKLGNQSPQIPSLFAYFVERGEYYLIQEFIEGQTLKEVAKGGPQDERFVRQLFLQLLPVLDLIHSQGIVHRDLKPDNIILRDRDRCPVVIDFGAVKETMGTVMTSGGHTAKSIIIGTPGFMPSEQAIGRPVYGSDLYALGLVGIFLLTGKLPQEWATDYDSGRILWREGLSLGDRVLEEVLERAIAPMAGDRYPSARAMLQGLQTTATPAPDGQTTPPTQMTTAIAPHQHSPHGISQGPATQNPDPSAPSTVHRQPWMMVAIVLLIMGSPILAHYWPRASVDNDPPPPPVNNNPPMPPEPLPEVRPEPGQAVRRYYGTLNNQDYGQAWQLLTPELRSDRQLHPQGYDSYLEWWTKVAFVEVYTTSTESQSGDRAVVVTSLNYQLVSGREVTQGLQFYFTWNRDRRLWLIEKVESWNP